MLALSLSASKVSGMSVMMMAADQKFAVGDIIQAASVATMIS
jgi:hypothetical protein